MELTLKRVFDYQRFFTNRRMRAMIEEFQRRYRSLNDENLLLVAALEILSAESEI